MILKVAIFDIMTPWQALEEYDRGIFFNDFSLIYKTVPERNLGSNEGKFIENAGEF